MPEAVHIAYKNNAKIYMCVLKNIISTGGFKMKKRLLSLALAAVMTIGTLPAVTVQTTKAAPQTEQKSSIDRSAYDGLGFSGLDATDDGESFFGKGNTVLMPKKELYLDYNGSSNYGQLLRSGLNMTSGGGGLAERGAYQRYGQYRNGDWAKLENKNGYTYGQLGGSELFRNVKSENKHQSLAYAESVAFNSGDGRDSNVATLYVRTSGAERRNQKLVLEISTFGDDGKSRSQSYYSVADCGENSPLNEKGYFYSADFTALIDITAGDFDGDGADEIAVYSADNTIRLYSYRNNRLLYFGKKTISSPEIYTNTGVNKIGDGSSNPSVTRAAVVTLESFDLDKNNADELVITVSAPRDVSGTKYKELSYGYIYGYDGNSFAQRAKIPLYDDSIVLQNANSAAGDFTGNSCNMLVFGGRAASTANPTKISIIDKIAVRTVTYNHNSKTYETGAIQKLGEDFNGSLMASGMGLKYHPPIAMMGFNMYGEKDSDGNSGERLFLFDRLYKYNGSSFQADGTTINYGSDQKNNANENANKDLTWILGVTKGNFTKKDIGRKEQLIAIVGQKESGSDYYWFQIAYLSTDNNNNPVRNWEGVLNQSNSYYNRTDKGRVGTYLTVCSPDVDHDSMVLKFKGSETYYSKPEVQAIMQSAPYFQDVADVYDDYLNNGATSYGKSESDSKGVSASIETSLGVYTSEEASLGGAAEFEASVAAVASYEHQSTWSTTKEVEYAGGIGDDYVVMYTVPFHRYVYDGTDLKGNTVPVIIEEPMTPVTVIVTVDKYDEIAQMYNGLEPIRGNVLKSTPGDPSSYTTWGKGDFKKIGETQLLTNAGKGNGSTVTVSQTDEYEQEHSFSVGIEENLKAGGGAGFLGNNVKAGVVQSLTASVGGVFSNMSGVAYTGTVDNLPEGVSDFAFNWQLGYSRIKFNGEDVIVIGYKTSNVKRPPTAPKNVAITDITRDTMTIEWDESPEAAVYELSFITADGEELSLANISGTAAENGVVSYEVKNLNPATTYSFSVRASDAYGVRSLASPAVTGTTLADGDDEFSITEQPSDIEAAAGTEAVFTVRAIGTGTQPIRYQWYSYDSENKSWSKTGSNSSELKISATEELDGSRYYCTVYQGTRVLKSKSVRLTIGLSASSTALSVSKGGKRLDNDDFVKADYEEVTKTSSTQKVWRTETADVGGTTYTRLAQGENAGVGVDGQVSYSYDAPYVWSTSDGSGVKYFADKSGTPDTADEFAVTSHRVFINGDSAENRIETEDSLVTLPAKISINGVDCIEGYKIIGSDACVYICKTADTDAEGNPITVAKYYVANAAGTYDEYTFDNHVDYINIGGTDCRTDSFVEVKKQYDDTVTGETSEHRDGDTLTLTAEVSDSTRRMITDGKLNFRITDKSTGVTDTVSGALSTDGKTWTADYRFSNVGAYDITAMYMGSNIYKTSVSDRITVNAFHPMGGILFINGGNLTYGSTLALAPIVIEAGRHANASGATYVIKKYAKDAKDKDILVDCSADLISNNVFAPDSVGKYEITATSIVSGNPLTANATVNVSPKTVTVTADNVEGNLDEAENTRRGKINVSIDGMSTADSGKLDYDVECAAFTAMTKGEYPIDLIVRNADDFSTKYSIVTERGTYSLGQDTVTVGATASANGSVLISYVTTKYDAAGNPSGKSTALAVESGAQVPKGADVTFSAQPVPGFGVDSWVVPEGMTAPGKSNLFVIENIDKNATGISVNFAYSLSRVEFSAADETGYPVGADVGTVVGAYADGRNFTSGDTLPSGKQITLTAKPTDGYVLGGWQKKNGADWEYIKAEDSDDNYTGLAITVSGVTSDEAYRAVFAPREEKTLTFSVTDFGGNSIASAQVFVNGTELAADESGKLTYKAYKHEKIDIEVRTPDTVLVNYWSLGGVSVAGSTAKYTVYDLKDSTECVIHCTIPNTRQISFGGVMTDGSVPTWTHEYLYATRDGKTVAASPSTQPQGVRIEFIAVPQDGYRVKEWRMNGIVVGGTAEKYVMTVDDNADITAVFEKKPVVTVVYDASAGNVSADVGGAPMGAYVEFGSDVDFTIEPAGGYIVKSATLNGAPAALTVGSENTDKRFVTENDINADLKFKVSFAKKPVITATVGHGGSAEFVGTADFTQKNISNGDYVDFGTDITVTVKPDYKYVIDSVTVDGTPVALTTYENTDDASFTLESVNADSDINIIFRALETVKFSFAVVNTEDGAESGYNGFISEKAGRKGMDAYNAGASYCLDTKVTIYEGSTVTLTATADNGYRVREWTIDGDVRTDIGNTLVLTYDEIASFTDKTVKVQFEEGKGRLTFTQPSGGIIAATVEGTEFLSGGTPEIGAVVEFTLTPDEHYVLKNWLLNGALLEGENELTYVFTASDADATVTAELEKEQLAVTAVAEANGTVGGLPTVVRHGDSVTLTATASPGYEFEGWYENGTRLDGAEAEYTFTAETDADFVAKFTEKEAKTVYAITVLPTENGTITATVNGAPVTEVEEGTSVTFTATADANYMFAAWTDDAASETTESFERIITANTTVGAQFVTSLFYDLIYGVAEGTDGGSVSGKTGETSITPNIVVRHARGSKLEFNALPNADKMVKAWTVNGEVKDELSNSLEFELLENTNVTVEFEDLKLWKIPSDVTGGYALTDIVRTPSDYGTDADRTVRDRGDAQFTVRAADGKTITAFAIPDDTADVVNIVKNDDASYSVKLEGVKKDIIPSITVEHGVPLTIETAANGTVTVKRGDEALSDGGAVKSGDELTITAAPNSGYRTYAIKVNGNVITNGKYTVADTDTAVVISAEFTTAGGGGGGGGGSSSGTFTVNFDSNGGSDVDSVKAAKNETVKKPNDPTRDGFGFDGWYTDKELTEKYDFAQKVTKSFTLYAKWNEKKDETLEWNNPFGDVKSDDWFFDSVKYANENSLMSGTEKDEFDPNGSVTRAMLVTILWRAEGKPQVNLIMPFDDVAEGEYYAEAVRWAASEGIVKGYSATEFAPDDNILREQIAAIMHRYATFKGYDMTVGENTNILSYADYADISEYAVSSLQYAVGSGLIKGKTDSTINPADNATRAETAEIIKRFIEFNK